jgi:signal transduction histidine kinase/DNA-binding response OmpR family regulator/CHASE3 domain sensor protein
MKHIKTVILLFSVAILGLAFVQFTSIKNNIEYRKNIESLNNRGKKIGKAYLVLKLLLDAETGTRGYLLTGIPTFLEPYEIAKKNLPVEMEEFKKYLNPDQSLNLSTIASARLNAAYGLIEKKKKNIPITSSELEYGKRIMDDFRKVIQGIVQGEESYLTEHDSEIKESFSTSIVEMIGGSLLSFILIGLTAHFVYTEFKKRSEAEKKLQISLATSEAISSDIDFGVIAADVSGNIIFANKWVFKKIKRHIKTVGEFFESNDLVGIPLKMVLAGEIDRIDQVEVQFNQQKYVLGVTAAPFKINQESHGVLLSIVDSTEAVEKMDFLSSGKKKAETASSNKSDFLAKMSHEIRTPLNAILGVGDILKLTNLSDEQQRCLDIFQRSAYTLTNLVNDILDLSKIEAGKIDIINAPFSLSNLIHSCTSIMDFRASQKGLLFTSEVICDKDHYVGDENRIRQIILNILGNAIKFTEVGEVNFKVKAMDESNNRRKLKFIIKDTGRGISEQNIGKLFADYQQEHSKISHEFGGTGLGLSLSRELARLMGGDIGLTSELGKGSEFTFYVTLEVAEGNFVQEEIDPNVNLRKFKLLLVDDNEENRFIVKRYLNDFGLEIVEAVDGEDAIATFKRQKFDLVLMDINMPKKDGLAATKDIRTWEKAGGHEHTCIIALSANALSQEFKKAQEVGCDDYLTKPISRLKLITTLRKWMGEQPPVQESKAMNDDEVDVDEELLALVPAYIENRKKDVELLREALNKKDIAVIGKISHNIKGTALSYGQTELDKISQVLNHASKEGDWETMKTSVAQIAELLGVK